LSRYLYEDKADASLPTSRIGGSGELGTTKEGPM